MNRSTRVLVLGLCCLALIQAARIVAQDEKAAVSLDEEQLLAMGIIVKHVPALTAPERIDAQGIVLDPTNLIADAGELAAAQAADRAAEAEFARVHALQGAAGASLKMVEAAQADQAKLRAQSQVAAANFALRWGPVAALPSAQRAKLLADLPQGQSLLIRADLLGRHGMGVLPRQALLDVDGVQVPGHVLGLLRQTGELQSVGLLVAVEHPPAGLGPGARIPMSLIMTERSGRILGRDALFYDESGPYVYARLPAKAGDGQAHFRPIRVRLLLRTETGWLVDGIGAGDDIVVQGAGALWSLQQMRAQEQSDDDS